MNIFSIYNALVLIKEVFAINRVYLSGPIIDYDDTGFVIASGINDPDGNLYIYNDEIIDTVKESSDLIKSCDVWAEVDALLSTDEDGDLFLIPVNINIISKNTNEVDIRSMN